MTTYEVIVGFNSMIGVEETYTVDATNEEEAEKLALFQAEEDLYVDSVEEVDDGEYDVVVNFNGYIGSEETYTVYAASEDEAESEAISEATNDLEVIDVAEMIDENKKGKINESMLSSKEASVISKRFYSIFDDMVDTLVEMVEHDWESTSEDDDETVVEWLDNVLKEKPNYLEACIGLNFEYEPEDLVIPVY